ncbi:MAG: O-methyltransferase [Bacteroidetes bacterium]|nr:O-methyltransferase [Bacteroidota bacterium]MBS1932329.1 O-methyltransferase [Bacteroidota bacterium]
MELINPAAQQYAEVFSSKADKLLEEIDAYTARENLDYQMLSGHLQGKVLEMISCMIRPRRILEIGTFTGYSALCLAKGLTEDGQLHTIEGVENVAKKTQEFFKQSIYRDKIILHAGNALTIIPILNEMWDLVFIDAHKPEYIDYYNLVISSVRKGGFILADNIFFHGEVLEEKATGKNAKGIKSFNEFIKQKKDIEKVILTIRDGLYLIRKI